MSGRRFYQPQLGSRGGAGGTRHKHSAELNSSWETFPQRPGGMHQQQQQQQQQPRGGGGENTQAVLHHQSKERTSRRFRRRLIQHPGGCEPFPSTPFAGKRPLVTAAVNAATGLLERPTNDPCSPKNSRFSILWCDEKSLLYQFLLFSADARKCRAFLNSCSIGIRHVDTADGRKHGRQAGAKI